jgi:hypothetical protein
LSTLAASNALDGVLQPLEVEEAGGMDQTRTNGVPGGMPFFSARIDVGHGRFSGSSASNSERRVSLAILRNSSSNAMRPCVRNVQRGEQQLDGAFFDPQVKRLADLAHQHF